MGVRSVRYFKALCATQSDEWLLKHTKGEGGMFSPFQKAVMRLVLWERDNEII